MKIIFYRLLLISLSITFASAVNAQDGYWEQLSGPTGGISVAITAAPDNTVYLTTTKEIFKRSPSDSGWVRVDALPGQPGSLTPFVFICGKLFMTNGITGIAMSSDGGKTWAGGGWRYNCYDFALSNRNL